MATEIYDGYARYYRLGWIKVCLRPALHAERMEVLRQAEVFKVELAATPWLLWNVIQRHVVNSNIDNFKSLPDDDLEAVFHLCMNWEATCEQADAENLAAGVRLVTRYPRIARRDCQHCQKWWFNEDTGTIVEQAGEPALRPEYAPPPCRVVGCPKGTPEAPRTLSRKNKHAWSHYQGCLATGSFPDDPIVRRNAQIISQAIQGAQAKARKAQVA